jgi:hypothetical protein
VDALILLVAFLVFMFIGIPVAYAMGLATLVTALWIDIPLEAIMLKISDGKAPNRFVSPGDEVYVPERIF